MLLGIFGLFWCAGGLYGAVENADDAMARAAAEVEHGEFAQAESGLRAFLREYPGNARASGLLGAALDGQQKFDEAEILYREALRRNPNSVLLLNNYGNHLLQRGDTEGARLKFEQACSIDPSHQNANLQLARLAVERHEGAAAIEFLSRLRDQRAPALQLLRAEALYWARRKEESFRVIANLENAYDADPRVHFSAGLAFSRMGQFARAEKAFSRALAKAPGDPDVLYNLGLASVGAGHDQRAEVDFQTLLRQHPDSVDALLELGRLRGRAGDGEDAIASLTKAARLAPQRADVLLALARALEASAFCLDSSHIYDEYLTLRPDDDVARRERAMVYGHVADLRPKGKAEFEWYIAKHPQDPLGHLYYALLLNAIPDHANALREISRAIELDPMLTEARRARAGMLNEDGEPEKAQADLEFLVKRGVKDRRVFDQLGEVYLTLDRPADAEQVLRQALALAPNDPVVQLHLGRALMQLGRSDEGQRMLAQSEQNRKKRNVPGPPSGALMLLSLPGGEQHHLLMENLRSAAARQPANVDVRLQLAGELLADGEMDEAARVFGEIRKLNPSPEVALKVARTALEADLFQIAADFYEMAVPSNPSARVELAMAHYFLSGAPVALADLEAIPSGQRSADYYLLKARILDLSGQADQALAALNQGLAGGPVFPPLAYQAAVLLVKAHRDTEALALLDRTARAAPDNPPVALARAIALDLTGQPHQADSAFARVEAQWPEWGRPYLVHALAARAEGKKEESARLLQAAKALGETETAGMTVESVFLNSSPQ